MFCDAGPLPQLAVAVVMLVATALIIRRLELPLLASQTSARTPRFWWMLAVFMGPLGIANRVLFCDGLFLQLTLIALVAGGGVWVGDRVIDRMR